MSRQRFQLSEREKQQVLTDFKNGKTILEISSVYGYPYQRVREVIAPYYEIKRGRQHAEQDPAITKKQYDISQDYLDGITSYKVLARRYGVSNTYVYSALKANNVKLVPQSSLREKILKAYENQALTQTMIANIFGVSRQYVSLILKQENEKKKLNKEQQNEHN